jgi:DNA helicase IV
VESKAALLAAEQAYFDAARAERERARAVVAQAPAAAAHSGAAAQLRRYAREKLDALGPPDEAVAVGRIDTEDGEVRYIGKRTVLDADGDVLVVNWHAPAAVPYHAASPADPLGLVRKRTFECTGNHIDDFTDVHFAALAAGVTELASGDPLLLRELARGRTGALRDIVATIQAAQFDLVRAPMDQLLVIAGGPGTGKTVVALHRVSWLLYNHRDRLTPADVLVVGPHPTFTRYIGTVLPALGDEAVDQLDIAQLAPPVRRGRQEPSDVERLKGEARMAGLLSRALDARIGTPEPAERLLVAGRFVTLPGATVAEVLADCRRRDGSYAQRRQVLRDRLRALVTDRVGAEGGRTAVDNLVERLWPQLTAPTFLRDLFGSRERLLAAAGADFTAAEVARLRRRASDRISTETWTLADLPLLDEAEALINNPPRGYAHIVVDEAQDLSPMQLRCVARRCPSGSLTVVGDLAQSTGAWARDSWDDVTAHLPPAPRMVTSLRYGYRVPRQVYEFAARLLPVAAPGTEAPKVVRDGPAEPGIHRVEPGELAGRTAAVAMAHAEDGRFVGIICPADHRTEVEAALAANGVVWSSADRGELGAAINLVSPQEAKGLEFDAVVVVEPEAVVAGAERGHRMLYVALTRTTRTLDVVCSGEPLPFAAPAPRPTAVVADPVIPVDPGQLDIGPLAGELAARVRTGCPPQLWTDLLIEVERLLRR